jgi:hypothetical protein
MPRVNLLAAAAVAVSALIGSASPLASAERLSAICASRIYDYLRQPVERFTIDFRQTELIDDAAYARYRADLVAAAKTAGYDPAPGGFTLHETLSSFPFLNRGRILEAILVLCAPAGESTNRCRRADYYLYDGVIDAPRLALILEDILNQAAPAPVDSCDFGQGDWSALD